MRKRQLAAFSALKQRALDKHNPGAFENAAALIEPRFRRRAVEREPRAAPGAALLEMGTQAFLKSIDTGGISPSPRYVRVGSYAESEASTSEWLRPAPMLGAAEMIIGKPVRAGDRFTAEEIAILKRKGLWHERPTTEEEEVQITDQTVVIYRDTENRFANGDAWSITTTAADLDAFVSALSIAFANAGTLKAQDIEAILTTAMPLAFKLSGYKADGVREMRTLVNGALVPSKQALFALSEPKVAPVTPIEGAAAARAA